MNSVHRNVSGILTLAAGVIIGWGVASVPGPRAIVRANGGDRSSESMITTVWRSFAMMRGGKVQISHDVLYYLDYGSGHLFATVPSFRQSAGTAKVFDNFAERDLVADFKIDLDNGARPRFMMTTGALGAYSEGWVPLYVFETTTNQVAAYKVQQQTIGLTTKHKFDLIEIRPIKAKSTSEASR